MTVFYIKDGNDVYELSATTDVSVQYSGTPTRFKVEDGSTITDHYTVENAIASFNGVITDIISLNNIDPTKTPKEYLEGLRRLQQAKRPFTVFVDDKLQPFDNCLFTNIGFDKSLSEGLSGWRVSLSFEQIRISDRARASIIKIDATTAKDGDKDTLSGKTDSGTTKTEKQELDVSYIQGIREGVPSQVGNALPKIDGLAGAG
jgi:hypothetical protein